MRPTNDPTIHVVKFPRAAQGGPSSAVSIVADQLVLIDHGTGYGEAVVAALSIGDVIDSTDGATWAAGVSIEVTMRSTEYRAWLEVDEPESEGPTHWPTRAVTHRALALMTRVRLDDSDEPPRIVAGAVSDSDGQCLVLVGMDRSGKSTLVAHLLESGLDLITDEQLAVHADRRVSAFARPVEIREEGLEYLPAGVAGNAHVGEGRYLSVAEFGVRHRLSANPVLTVVLIRHHDPVVCRAELLSPTQALDALCLNNLDLEHRPLEALESFAGLATTVPTVALYYYDSREAALTLRSLFRDPPTLDAVEWSVHCEADTPESTPAPDDSKPPLRGRPVRRHGVYTASIGDTVLLLDPRQLLTVRLNPDGARLWHALPQATTSYDAESFLDQLKELGFVAEL